MPTNVFLNPNPGDATNTSVSIHVNSSKVTASDVDDALVTIHDVAAGTSSGEFSVSPFANPFTVTSTLYAFKPNTQYTFDGRLDYPFNTTTLETGKGPFWTTPNDPGVFGSDGIVSETHVTVTVRFHNSFSGATIGNPGTGGPATKFDLQFTPTSGPTITVVNAIQSVTGLPTEQLTVLTAGLKDGTFYTAQVRAENNGAGWPNSNWITIGTFTTIAWSLTLTIPPATVFQTSATAHIAVTDASGLDHYYVLFSPQAIGPRTVWPSGLSVDYQNTALTPNQQYQVQAELCEQPASTEYCSTLLPTTPVSFTSQPANPVGPTNLIPYVSSMTVSWQDSANPNGTTYLVEACPNGLAFGNAGCTTEPFTKAASGAQVFVLTRSGAGATGPLITAETLYNVRVTAINSGGSPWPNSGPLSLGSATTGTQITALTISPNPVTGTTANVSATADDNGGLATLTYAWSNVSGPAAVAFSPSTNKNAVATFTSAGAYVIQMTVTDSLSRTFSENLAFNVLQTPITAAISPANDIVNQGGPVVTYSIVSAVDQFNHAIVSPSVVWSMPGGSGGNTFNAGAGTFNPNGMASTYTVQGISAFPAMRSPLRRRRRSPSCRRLGV